jgi:hypothetical protein
MAPKASIFIATPCYGGLVYASYTTSLLETIMKCGAAEVEVKLALMGNESLITRARNQLVAQFLQSECTHMLFIDADITWQSADVLKLLEWDRDIIGGIYPMKDYFFDRSEEAMEASFNSVGIFNPDVFKSKLLSYPINYKRDTTQLHVNKGLCKLKYIPTGFMMIKRDVFTKLIKKYPEAKLTQDANRDATLDPFLYNFFDCAVDPDTKCYLSEDFAFCKRYRDLDPDNNEVYADVSIRLNHTGTHTFKGHYGLSLLPKGTF